MIALLFVFCDFDLQDNRLRHNDSQTGIEDLGGGGAAMPVTFFESDKVRPN